MWLEDPIRTVTVGVSGLIVCAIVIAIGIAALDLVF